MEKAGGPQKSKGVEEEAEGKGGKWKREREEKWKRERKDMKKGIRELERKIKKMENRMGLQRGREMLWRGD